MKKILLSFLICLFAVNTFSQALSKSSEIIKTFQTLYSESKFKEAVNLFSSKADKKAMELKLTTTFQTYGNRFHSYFIDSVYSKNEKTKVGEVKIRLSSYYDKGLLIESFTVINESGKDKLSAYSYDVEMGRFNDDFLLYGALKLPELFLQNIVENKLEDAYGLCNENLTSLVSMEQFTQMAAEINNALGEIKEFDYIDTISVLNMRDANQNMGQTLVRIGSSTGEFLYKVTFTFSDLKFFIQNFEFISHGEINRPEEINKAEALMVRFYEAYNKSDWKSIYSLFHSETQKIKSLETVQKEFETMLKSTGKSVKQSVASSLVLNNLNNWDSSEHMFLIYNQCEKALLGDTFLFQYDSDNEMKITYVYLNEL